MWHNTGIIVTDCTFNRNSAKKEDGSGDYCDGGAIYWNTPNGQITNSTFINNTAGGYSGAIDWNTNTDFSMTDSTFIGNTAQLGGAINFRQAVNNIKVTDSVFDANTATGIDAGAIYVHANSGNVEIDNCNFTNQKSYRVGGAIYVGQDTNKFTVTNSNFKGGETGWCSGAIYFDTHIGSMSISNTNFTDNKVTNLEAGAFNIPTIDEDIEITKCNFTRNSASGYAGALLIGANDHTVTITDSTFDFNIAGSNGGAIFTNGGSATHKITSTTFTNNYASGTGDEVGGGSVYALNALTIQDSSFANGGAEKGGALYLYASGTTIDNTNFTGNVAKMGGAVYARGETTLTKTTFTGNNASSNYNGGAIYANAKVTAHDSTFTDNHAARGGAVYVNIGGSTIDTSTFTNNGATQNGGAIYVNAGATTIDQNTFVDNSAVNDGNDIYILQGVSNVVSNSNFAGVNHIYVDSLATASITNNRELSTTDGDYTIKNVGTIALSKNTFHNIIYNNGTITSQTYANVTRNTTYTWDEWSFPTYAHVYDDNNNTIMSVAFTYTTDRGDNDAEAEDSITHNGTLSVQYFKYVLGAKDTGLQNLKVHTSVINMVIKVGSYTWLQENIDKLTGSVLSLTQNVTFNATYDLHPNNPYMLRGINLSDGMIYNKTFNLQGNGYTISGNNQARIFKVTSSGVTIGNINLINGSARNGGALYIASNLQDITIEKAHFENNVGTGNDESTDGGGAIYSLGGINSISIRDSTFNNNTAISGGAILFFAADDGYRYNGITLSNVNFTNNNATLDNYWGGSAISMNRANTVNINNCNFNDNYAAANGAILFDACHDVDVINTDFINNTAGRSAGAIFFNDRHPCTDVLVENCLFDENVALGNGAQSNNLVGHGGALFVACGATFNNCNFTDNEVKGNGRHGGAVYLYSVNNAVNMNNVNFINNKAAGWGGAIFANSGSNYGLIVKKSSFVNNSASAGGAADLTMHGIDFQDTVFVNNTASENAGALWVETNGQNKFTNCNFTENHADKSYGVLYVTGQGNVITGCEFTNNTANSVSAVYVNGQGSTISASKFIGNEANDYGALWFIGDQGKILDSVFNYNKGGNGAGIYTTSYQLNIQNSNFTANIATGDGGAVSLGGMSENVKNCIFNKNEAQNGGAIYVVNSSSNDARYQSITIEDSSFDANKAKNEGGAIYNGYIGSTIKNSNFTNNAALKGGAISVGGNYENIQNCIFKANNATQFGGAVYVGKVVELTIQKSTFENSFAYNGGAVYNLGTTGAEVKIIEDTFIKNIATHNGGAVYYIVNNDASHTPIIYRDYNNFDGQATVTDGKTTLTMVAGSSTYSNVIYNSIFTDNEDYFLNVTAYAPQATVTGLVVISNPRDIDRRSVKIIVNITNEEGFFKQIVVDKDSWDNHVTNSYNDVDDTLTIRFDNLPTDMRYNVTVSFEDANYMHKEANTTFLVGNERMGDFHILQGLIDRTPEGGVLVLDRDYVFSDEIFNGKQLDDWHMNITKSITIDGRGYTIDAKGHCRIFEITGNNVTLSRIVFINGDVNGADAHGSKLGGAIYWEGSNGTVYNSTFQNNTADYGGAIYIQNDHDKVVS